MQVELKNDNRGTLFENLVTVKDVAAYFATNERHIMDLVREGKIPAHYVGRKLRFCLRDVMAATLVKGISGL